MTLTVPTGEAISAPPAGCPAATATTLTCDVGAIAAASSIDVHAIVTPDPGTQTLTDSVALTSDQVQLSDDASALSVDVAANPTEPQPTSVNNPIDHPAPAYGAYLRLDRESGTVTAKLPNGQRIDLRNYAIIPVGTIVSTTAGRAQVTAKLKDGSSTVADFKYGQFKLGQSASTGLINAQMNAPLSGCSASQLSTTRRQLVPGRSERWAEAPFRPYGGEFAFSMRSAIAPLLGKHKRTTRRLWGHDRGGSYRITGNRGAATVQGTTWEVLDTCTTTTVISYQDTVTVTGTGNTVPRRAVVRAGHRVVLRAG